MKVDKENKTLEHIVRRMQTDTAIDAPADLITFAKNLYRTRPAKQGLVQRVAAVLKADLAPNRAAFGERSAAGAAARQMLFESGTNALDLRIKAIDKAFELRGQVLGDGFENATVEVVTNGEVLMATLDEMASFRFDMLEPNTYQITIKGTDTEIFIESLTI